MLAEPCSICYLSPVSEYAAYMPVQILHMQIKQKRSIAVEINCTECIILHLRFLKSTMIQQDEYYVCECYIN